MSTLLEGRNPEIATLLKQVKPEVAVRNGNAMAVITASNRAITGYLRGTKQFSSVEIQSFTQALFKEATSGDYDHVLGTCMEYTSL